MKSARDELTNKGDIIVLAATAFIVRTQVQFTFSFPWCFNNERGWYSYVDQSAVSVFGCVANSPVRIVGKPCTRSHSCQMMVPCACTDSGLYYYWWCRSLLRLHRFPPMISIVIIDVGPFTAIFLIHFYYWNICSFRLVCWRFASLMVPCFKLWKLGVDIPAGLCLWRIPLFFVIKNRIMMTHWDVKP